MKRKSLLIKWVLCLIPAVIALVLYLVLPRFNELTESVFARIVFRVAVFPLEWVVSFIPFSVTEAVVVLAVPILLTLLIVFIVRIIKSQSRLKTAEKGVRFVAFCLSLALLMFMLNDGVNFSRTSVGDLLELPNKKYTADELYAVTSDLAKKAATAREKLPEDENGCAILSVDMKEMLSLADDSYKNLKKDYPFLITASRRVKPVKLSHYWSYTGTTGVYCPWLGEASVNVDVPHYDIGHTAAHEIAHTMGFAKENECNFLAWLACATSGLPDYEYSGHLAAFVYCSNALYKADKELWKNAYMNCSKGMLRDLKQSSDYWDSFEGEVMEVSQNANDTFIKVNGVESGVLSYNQMVELMLRYYQKQNLLK